MTFDPAAIAAFKADALARWPEEACGLVTPTGYVPCANRAADPRIDFRVADADFAAAGEVLAVLHSHTHRRTAAGDLVAKPIDAPSLSDQIHQPATGAPWGIACVTRSAGAEVADHVTEPFFFGDEIDPPALVGRSFRWGVSDCLALVRDWHRARGIAFGNVPREEGWEAAADLFRDNFAAVGFRPVDGPVRDGDCFLMRINADVPNHCGIVDGDGLLLHHLAGRLSGHAPLVRLQRQFTHRLRHKDLP